MSGDDHGHNSGHGHDSHDGPTDIIPVGSWQDKLLLMVCLATLVGLSIWAQGFQLISETHQGESASETHSSER